MHKVILAPVIYGEAFKQVLVVEEIHLPEQAIKIINVSAEVRELTGHVCTDKVIFQGVLHKQILFVNKHYLVQHFQTDIPFSGFAEVPCASPGMEIRFEGDVLKDECTEELLSCSTILHEKQVLDLRIIVFLTEKVCLDQKC